MNILFSLLLLLCLTINIQAQRLQWQPVNGQEITFLPTTNTVKALLGQNEKIFIALTNTGVMRSLDAGMTWQQSNQGLPTTNTRTITTLGSLLVCGVTGSQTQQEGLFSSSDTARTWQRISSRSIGTTSFLQGIEKSIIGNGGGEAFLSNDTGKTWNVLFSDKLGVSSGFFFEDNVMYTTIYFSNAGISETMMYQSNDKGKQWKTIGKTIGAFSALQKIDTTLFILTRDISPVPQKLLRYYINLPQWKVLFPISDSDKEPYISTIHKVGKRLLYADNGNGIYSSDDLGETWQSDKQGLPPTFFINQFVTIGNFVYAVGSVFGKGGIIYRASLAPLTSVREESKPPLASPCFLDNSYPNPAQDASTLLWHIPTDTEVSLTVYDMLRRPVLKPLVLTKISAGTHETMLNVRHLPSGNYIIILRAGEHLCTKIISIVH